MTVAGVRENLTYEEFGRAVRQLASSSIPESAPVKRTDEWINFPCSVENPVVKSRGGCSTPEASGPFAPLGPLGLFTLCLLFGPSLRSFGDLRSFPPLVDR